MIHTTLSSTSPSASRRAARVAAPVLGLLAALTLAAPAVADPTSTPTTADPTGAITTAVTTSPEAAGVGADAYTVTDVRTAASDPSWAAAQLEPTATSADRLDPATVVLQQVDGTWAVVSLGTAFVGCEETVPAVATELGLLC